MSFLGFYGALYYALIWFPAFYSGPEADEPMVYEALIEVSECLGIWVDPDQTHIVFIPVEGEEKDAEGWTFQHGRRSLYGITYQYSDNHYVVFVGADPKTWKPDWLTVYHEMAHVVLMSNGIHGHPQEFADCFPNDSGWYDNDNE